MKQSTDEDKKVQAVKEATSFLFHKHYCENDVETIIQLFDDKMSWIGAGENEYAMGTEAVSDIFRQFAGMVPKCNIWNEEYNVIDISPDVYICTGRAWIATDPSTSIYLRVHQRITAVFRWADGTPRCCHIHALLGGLVWDTQGQHDRGIDMPQVMEPAVQGPPGEGHKMLPRLWIHQAPDIVRERQISL